MSAVQLRLFPSPRPLLELLGGDFFRKIPAKPGVYLFNDAGGRLLYVGQSANLKQRLRSYCHVIPERNSRKVVRLVHRTQGIVWEICSSAETAVLRENQLLRLHRPPFNKLNTYPQAHAFFGVSAPRPGQVRLRRTHLPNPHAGEELFGSFKGQSREAFGCAVRWLWRAQNETSHWPRPLLRPAFLTQWDLQFPESEGKDWLELLRNFFLGTSMELLENLRLKIWPRTTSAFEAVLFETDQELLETFYLHGPLRNCQLRHREGWFDELIGQEELDDLLSLHALAARRSSDLLLSPGHSPH